MYSDHSPGDPVAVTSRLRWLRVGGGGGGGDADGGGGGPEEAREGEACEEDDALPVAVPRNT